jgi:putative transcriptional regulator
VTDDYPGPIAELLGGAPPRWKPLGFGTKQAILWRGSEGVVRLLSIPAGQAVPDHGHRGIELTLVLSGSFSDEVGTFRAGDLEVADEGLVHVPKAGAEGPCICAAATDAPLRFQSFVPRLLQPILRI